MTTLSAIASRTFAALSAVTLSLVLISGTVSTPAATAATPTTEIAA